MKIALITGGSRGLGRNMALHLARRGVGIILTYHARKDAADEARAEIEALGVKAAALPLDVTQSGSFPAFAQGVKAKLAEVWGRTDFDYLVNNAGTGAYAPIAETSVEKFDEMVAIHLKAPFFLTQALLPLIRDGGRIINVSSGLARFSYPGYAAYAMMKGGVEVFTRYLAKELGPRGIAANVIAPGAIATDFGGGRVRDDAEINHMIASQTALGRVGLPDDIGGAVAALLSDESGWINGQRIEVSGGIHL
ncbi:SDR family NAD(P)-dependent oxidoreductase [Rhodoblastus sp.]|uniref:SDR family NAD(P)-dependent oxidoreductase n=1 Tax=Rhodoblastus sp. TaxID=1962975 RepID=UPI0035AE4205